MKTNLLWGAAVLAAAGMGSAASADVIAFSSNGFGLEGLGSFSGSLAYSANVLTISITNDLASAAGGKITAIAFNINGNATATLTSSTYASFQNLSGPISASPFNDLEAGASISSSWLGGGNPAPGIARGDTGVFVFSVTGGGAGSLTAADFITGPDAVNFAVRFRGFSNGGSDKGAGHLVPTPGSLALVGLGGLAGLRRRR